MRPARKDMPRFVVSWPVPRKSRLTRRLIGSLGAQAYGHLIYYRGHDYLIVLPHWHARTPVGRPRRRQLALAPGEEVYLAVDNLADKHYWSTVAPSNLTGANTGNLLAHFGSPRTVLASASIDF